MNFTNKDLKQLKEKGLTKEEVIKQITILKTGIGFTHLKEAATLESGIFQLNDKLINTYVSVYNNKINDIKILKFVPASGAATRMFKFLFQFVNEFDPKQQSLNAYINKNKLKDLSIFLAGLEKFPFYESVVNYIKSKGIDYDNLPNDQQAYVFAQAMLHEDQLNYSNFPKGLLPFHTYKNGVSTAFEEHLFETALYTSTQKPSLLHFTISERFEDHFNAEFKRIEEKVEELTGTHFDISFSYQHQSTDTIAVTVNNEAVRESDESLHFRPSGHGALLKNLNALDADLIFIKNIDNVVVKKYKEEVALYKKVLAGILLDVQQKTFNYLKLLDENEIDEPQIEELTHFLTHQLNVKHSNEISKYSYSSKIEYLKECLNRPLRVCGMVKNEGEPGGGPFWVINDTGNVSLQIVESAQINKKNEKQKEIFNNSTHFNPVDIVCGVKNYKGQKFDLQNYVDHKAAFITMKTKDGKDIKALELPGLWNGSMAFWNTIFVEVPLITFNPVKTVNDLLKSQHQIK